MTFLLANWKAIGIALLLAVLCGYSFHLGSRVEAATWERAELDKTEREQKQRDKTEKEDQAREVANEKERQATAATIRDLQQKWEATNANVDPAHCRFTATGLRLINASLSGRPTAR
jgi:hypothetical protein